MTRDELITKKFSHSLIGYDISAVDRFIDDVIREFDRLHAELDGLKRELSGSTAESVIEEADVIEAEDERKKLEHGEWEIPDETYGSFLSMFEEQHEVHSDSVDDDIAKASKTYMDMGESKPDRQEGLIAEPDTEEKLSEKLFEEFSEELPGELSEELPNELSEELPNELSEEIHGEFSEELPNELSDELPNELSDQFSEESLESIQLPQKEFQVDDKTHHELETAKDKKLEERTELPSTAFSGYAPIGGFNVSSVEDTGTRSEKDYEDELGTNSIMEPDPEDTWEDAREDAVESIEKPYINTSGYAPIGNMENNYYSEERKDDKSLLANHSEELLEEPKSEPEQELPISLPTNSKPSVRKTRQIGTYKPAK